MEGFSHPNVENGWFNDKNPLWPGTAASVEVERILHHERSPYQDILVFDSTTIGRVLVIDGIIQLTEKEEHAYHELIVHLPLFSHPNPKSVLVVGGGDGGTVREVAKHSCVEEIEMCEIDERVIEVSKKYLPTTASSFSEPRLTLHIQDGLEFVKSKKERYDIIITDCCDPVEEGPASCLFNKSYYESIYDALKPNGIACYLGENAWIANPGASFKMLQAVFPVVAYAWGCQGQEQLGFHLSSKNPATVFKDPPRKITKEQVKQMKLQYYNSGMHRGALTLPQFMKEALYG